MKAEYSTNLDAFLKTKPGVQSKELDNFIINYMSICLKLEQYKEVINLAPQYDVLMTCEAYT
jgi:hypothetical protein